MSETFRKRIRRIIEEDRDILDALADETPDASDTESEQVNDT